MLTANYMTYPRSDVLKPEYRETEDLHSTFGIASWGAIDAPDIIPAGSTYLYQPHSQGMRPFDMPRSFARE